jgi:hypothetical protein
MSSNTEKVKFIDDAAIAAMVAFREKFDFSREQDYADCSAMAFKLAQAMYAQREENNTEAVPVAKTK